MTEEDNKGAQPSGSGEYRKKTKYRFLKDDYTIMSRLQLGWLSVLTSAELHLLLAIMRLYNTQKNQEEVATLFTTTKHLIVESGMTPAKVQYLLKTLIKKNVVEKQPLTDEELATVGLKRMYRLKLLYINDFGYANFLFAKDIQETGGKGFMKIPNYSHFGDMYQKGYELVVFVQMCFLTKPGAWYLQNLKTGHSIGASYIAKCISKHRNTVSNCLQNLQDKDFVRTLQRSSTMCFPLLRINVKHEKYGNIGQEDNNIRGF